MQDTSNVFHIDMIDDEAKAALCYEPGRDWLFETDDDIQVFATEEAACAAQRQHRSRLGFDPMTGLTREDQRND